MKKLQLTLGLFIWVTQALAQISIKGQISDFQSGSPLPSATVELDAIRTINADAAGNFVFSGLKSGRYHFRVSNIGYKTLDTLIQLQENMDLAVKLSRLGLFMQPIEVRPLRAGDKAPFTKTNLGKKEIE